MNNRQKTNRPSR